jgi:hypothetical protein
MEPPKLNLFLLLFIALASVIPTLTAINDAHWDEHWSKSDLAEAEDVGAKLIVKADAEATPKKWVIKSWFLFIIPT